MKSTRFCQNIFIDLQEIGPTGFSSTPRLWNKLYQEFLATVERELAAKKLTENDRSIDFVACSRRFPRPIKFTISL